MEDDEINIIKRLEGVELTGADIDRFLTENDMLKITSGKCRILPYSKLINYNNIDEVLGPNKCMVLLYELEPNHGHWICMFRNDDGQLIFYDSLGYGMDDELKFINRHRKMLGYPIQNKTLTKLVGNERVISNRVELQEDIRNIATCGRYSVIRLLLRNLSNAQFNKIFLNNRNQTPDFLVTYLTTKLL